jgi:hypothetical protein
MLREKCRRNEEEKILSTTYQLISTKLSRDTLAAPVARCVLCRSSEKTVLEPRTAWSKRSGKGDEMSMQLF